MKKTTGPHGSDAYRVSPVAMVAEEADASRPTGLAVAGETQALTRKSGPGAEIDGRNIRGNTWKYLTGWCWMILAIQMEMTARLGYNLW